MKYALKVIILFVGLFFTDNISHSQETSLSKTYNINDFVKIDKVDGIEIYNTWTGKKWIINKKSLLLVKSILKKSFVSRTLALKPGHLYIKFLGKIDFSKYDTYMYDGAIYFDPYLNDPGSTAPKNISPFTIILKREIDWEHLK